MCKSIKRLNPQSGFNFFRFDFFLACLRESLDTSGFVHRTSSSMYIVRRAICRRRGVISRVAYACVQIFESEMASIAHPQYVPVISLLLTYHKATCCNLPIIFSILFFSPRSRGKLFQLHSQRHSVHTDCNKAFAPPPTAFVYLHNLNGIFCRCWFLFVTVLPWVLCDVVGAAKLVVVQITRKMHFTTIRVGW